MNNLLKMEKYQLSHNIFYWCGLIGIFLIGFFTADTYVPEAMGPMGGAATSLADIFNGMVYDSTFLLIIISSILALILGQEFSSRTIDLEVNAGHSRKTIFFAKVISYLIAFNIMALVYWLLSDPQQQRAAHDGDEGKRRRRKIADRRCTGCASRQQYEGRQYREDF